MIARLFVCVLFLIQLSACTSPEDSSPMFDISLKVEPPKEFRMKTMTTQIIQSGLKNSVVSHRQNIETYGYLKINRKTETGIDISVNYTRVRCLLQGHKDNILFDSEKDTKVPAPAIEYAKLVGTSFSATLDKFGNVLSLSGSGSLDEKNEESLRVLFQHTFAFYPTKKVKVGETWSKATDLSEAAGMRIQTKWILNSVQEGYYSLTSNGIVESSRKSENTSFVELRGTQQGELLIREESGLPELITVSREMSGSTINPNKGTRMPMAIKTDTKFELHELIKKEGTAATDESEKNN